MCRRSSNRDANQGCQMVPKLANIAKLIFANMFYTTYITLKQNSPEVLQCFIGHDIT